MSEVITKAMITAQVESLADRLAEMKVLFPLHWKELALNQEHVPLDPQYEVYEARAARGETMLVTLRQAGRMVGYFVGFVAPGLHYKTCLTLTMDIFWTHPDIRGGLASVKLFREVKREAQRRGVKRIFVGSKLHKDASRLFEAMGYTEVERYYSMWLGA